LWLANRHIKNAEIRWRRYRPKKLTKLDKHIAVKNGMRWIKFHGFFSPYQKNSLTRQLDVLTSLVAHALRRGNGCDDVTH
jgi:hypothetical protein